MCCGFRERRTPQGRHCVLATCTTVLSTCPWRTPTCKTNRSAASCACASGDPASRLSRTGSATAADTAGPGTATGWRGPARATAGTHRPAFPRDKAPARPLLQEATEECRGGVCYRRNWVRNALAAPLNCLPPSWNRWSGLGEPGSSSPGDQRRGDIKVINNSGTSWILERPNARLDLRGDMDALHCVASRGHWRFNRAIQY
jgi:hypothetical protein